MAWLCSQKKSCDQGGGCSTRHEPVHYLRLNQRQEPSQVNLLTYKLRLHFSLIPIVIRSAQRLTDIQGGSGLFVDRQSIYWSTSSTTRRATGLKGSLMNDLILSRTFYPWNPFIHRSRPSYTAESSPDTSKLYLPSKVLVLSCASTRTTQLSLMHSIPEPACFLTVPLPCNENPARCFFNSGDLECKVPPPPFTNKWKKKAAVLAG